VQIDDGSVRIERQTEDGYAVVEGPMPALISVVEKINQPRYPSFKGIMAAKSRPLTTLTLDDLGIDPAEVGLAGATNAVKEFTDRPPRSAGEVVKDDGSGGVKVAEFLATKKFI
jgi:electron transfer flavoprotein beta subunit